MSRQARYRVTMLVGSQEGALADCREIARARRLDGAPLAKLPDAHGFYARGETSQKCPSHPEPLTLREDGDSIELSPLWKRALERTFRVCFPNTIRVTPAAGRTDLLAGFLVPGVHVSHAYPVCHRV